MQDLAGAETRSRSRTASAPAIVSRRALIRSAITSEAV